MATPGPRKFLPSNSQFKTPKPKWKIKGVVGPSSQASSSTKQPSSSQFAATPQFIKTTDDTVDDIEGSFEDGQSSPSGPHRRRTVRPVSTTRDELLDEEEHAGFRFKQLDRPRSTTEDHDVDVHKKASHVSEVRDTIHDVDEDDFPQPSSKRLKTSSGSTRHVDALLISFSESVEDQPKHDDEDLPSTRTKSTAIACRHSPKDAFDFDSDLSDLSPSPTNALSTTSIPRFKLPTVAVAAGPSSTRPVFKAPLPSQSASKTIPLPDTFSPSRRRGNRDYIPGGYADTVRNWVLELGTSLSKPPTEESKTLRVVKVRHDVEGRCATVLSEKGQELFLVSQGQQADAGSIGVGDTLEMSRGWTVDLEGIEVGETNGRSANVSVSWKRRR